MREFRRFCVMFSWMVSLGLFLLYSLLFFFISFIVSRKGWHGMQCNAMGREGKGLGIDIQGIGKARIGFMVYNDISLKYHGSKERNRIG